MKVEIIQQLKDLFKNIIAVKKGFPLQQASILFSAMVLAMGFNFAASIITARMLGPQFYGDMKFMQTFWALLTILASFGYFHSGSRVLVLQKEMQSIREIIGTVLVISLVFGLAMCLLTMAVAYPMDKLFNMRIAAIMIYLAPFVIIMPVNAALVLILQGTNRIHFLSILTAVPPLLDLLTIFVLFRMGLISTSTVILSNQIPLILVAGYIIFRLKPSLKQMKFWWRELSQHNKTYGGPVYRGSLANVASAYISRLAISFWVDNTSIGFYSLANSLTEPLKFIPNAVATASFRSFATRNQIAKKTLFITLGLSVISLLTVLVLFGKPLAWVYTENFAPVSAMAKVMSIGAIMVGLGDFCNRFLGAHGKGKSLRNVAYISGSINLIGFFFLVPSFGVWGAVATSVLGGTAYCVFMYVYYRRFISEANSEKQPTPQPVENA